MSDTFYQMYLKELQEIAPCTEAELEELAARLAEGDLSVASRVIEGNLFRVLEIVEDFREGNVLISDLVQEGNMALTLAVGEYTDGGYGEFVPYIESEIRRAMETFIEEQCLSDRAAKRVLDRVEMLNTVSEAMVQELGREATLEELVQKTGLPEEEIREIMKMALDALTPGE